MSQFRVLAVDDEPLARETVRDLLERDPQVRWIGECGDGRTALEEIRDKRPDIVFLDVEMPERGGLEVLAALDPETLPAIVFLTAYNEYAVRAFELEALDYVVKPFSDQRFFAALERAKRRVREQRLGELAGKMVSLSAELGAGKNQPVADEIGGTLSRIRVSSGDRTLILKAREVVWIESEDYYARLHTARGTYLVRTSLTTFEQELDPAKFVRIHRGAIVNLDEVVEIEHLFKGAKTVVLANGHRIRISRARQRHVEEILVPKLGQSSSRR